jgi:hypothetical protein
MKDRTTSLAQPDDAPLFTPYALGELQLIGESFALGAITGDR